MLLYQAVLLAVVPPSVAHAEPGLSLEHCEIQIETHKKILLQFTVKNLSDGEKEGNLAAIFGAIGHYEDPGNAHSVAYFPPPPTEQQLNWTNRPGPNSLQMALGRNYKLGPGEEETFHSANLPDFDFYQVCNDQLYVEIREQTVGSPSCSGEEEVAVNSGPGCTFGNWEITKDCKEAAGASRLFKKCEVTRK
jgi:hypothetical protein